MTMTDPIADMLTRIRNANIIGRDEVTMPFSRIKQGVAEALKREGFLADCSMARDEQSGKGTLTVRLKFGPDGEKVITEIARVSKPGKRIYRSAGEVAKVLSGFGAEIYTTDQGILSDRECRARKVGGEVLLIVR